MNPEEVTSIRHQTFEFEVLQTGLLNHGVQLLSLANCLKKWITY